MLLFLALNVLSNFIQIPFNPLMVSTMKMPCPSSNSMKIKTLIQSHIYPHLWPIIRALTKAKSMVKDLLKKNKKSYNKKNRHRRNMLCSSIRFHYNWCSSHVLPMPEPAEDELESSHMYYDSSWNSVIPSEEDGGEEDDFEPQLSSYLRWLEEKHAVNSAEELAVDEIDRLADMFIANCHEKFRLEKQESYRRYQEMLARSM